MQFTIQKAKNEKLWRVAERESEYKPWHRGMYRDQPDFKTLAAAEEEKKTLEAIEAKAEIARKRVWENVE